MAIKVYDGLITFLDNYITEDTGYLYKLESNIDRGIKDLQDNSSDKFSIKPVSRESTSIDMTSRADMLATSKAELKSC